MKIVTIYFEDDDFKKLKEIKGKRTWRELVLSTLKKDKEKETDENV